MLLATRRKSDIEPFLQNLPKDYHDAFLRFAPLLPAEDTPSNAFFASLVVGAAAELALDWPFVCGSDDSPNFTSLLGIFKIHLPRIAETLESLVVSWEYVTSDGWSKILPIDQRFEEGMEGDAALCRHLVVGIKRELARETRGERVASRVFTDHKVNTLKNLIDQDLRSRFPQLGFRFFDPNRIDLGAVKVELKKPGWELEERTLTGDELITEIMALEQEHNTIAVGISLLKDPRTERYWAHVFPVRTVGETMDLALHYWNCSELNTHRLLQIDTATRLPLVWLTPALMTSSGEVFSGALWNSLGSSVFLHGREFGWHYYWELASKLAPVKEIVMLPMSTGIWALSFETGRISVFSFVPFEPKDIKFKEIAVKAVSLQERPLLAIASLIAYRTFVWPA